MFKNKLYFGDNLEVMQDLPSRSVDLIATDPPFKSGRIYNIIHKDSLALKKAYNDTWKWDEFAINTQSLIKTMANEDEAYAKLNTTLEAYDILLNHAIKGKEAEMRSYLYFMGPRIVEMHRILKDTGTFYLHCDPTASHYLKGILDTVFGLKNYRNEIVWCYNGGAVPKKDFPRKHDLIFRYVKKGDWVFNIERKEYKENTQQVGKHSTLSGGKDIDLEKGTPITDWWTDIKTITGWAPENTGYPTQKPKALYERIIKASTNPGDVVMDPFCGCGTTILAAQSLGRNWIGIDLTQMALTTVKGQLFFDHRLKADKDYIVHGYPINMQEVEKWLENDKKRHAFADWAVRCLGLDPTKNVGDGGIDGVGSRQIYNVENMEIESARIVAEVKTGKVNKTQVRAFCQSMTDNEALVGIIISLHPPTAAMREYQGKLGRFEHNGQSYNKLQFWQIDDRYFDNPESVNHQVKLPLGFEKSF